MSADLDIIIVSYNASVDLERCLQSLRAHPPRLPHTVTVVDNASHDGCVDVATRADAHVMPLPVNVGFAAANNVGIRATAAPLILLLNSDTVVPAGAVDGLVARLMARPDVAAVGPRLIDASGAPELSHGPMLSLRTEWALRRLARRRARGDRAALAWIEAQTRVDHEPDWVTGACLLVRRVDAERAGLLDERFFMYTEDVDFCAALRALGRRILFAADVTVTHLRGRSGATAPAATRAAYVRSHIAFYRKHHPWSAPLVRAWHRLGG